MVEHEPGDPRFAWHEGGECGAHPGELRKVKLQYRCDVCGTEVRMTAANDQMPEPPRHCLEDMILVTPDGHENLSASLPKRAADIERVMADGKRAGAWRRAR